MKMKNLLASLLITFAVYGFTQDSAAVAKDTSYWQKGGTYNLNFSRVQLRNWAGGGQNSIALSSILKLNANYEKGKTTWYNSFDLNYGLARVGTKENAFKKSDDQLILVSKFGYQIKKRWSYSGMLDFRTQIAPGYTFKTDTIDGEPKEVRDQTISRFLAPAYTLVSLGIQYRNKDKYYVVLSPVAGKITIVADDDLNAVGAFGVDEGEPLRFELGSVLKAGYKTPVMTNVEFSTNLMLFQGYETMGHIDVNWETLLVFKINKYLSTTFSTLLIYDDDVDVVREDDTVGPAIQFRDVLNVGFLYKF